MTSAAHAREIIEHYERRGLRGLELAERVIRHARLLSLLEDDVTAELFFRVRVRRLIGGPS